MQGCAQHERTRSTRARLVTVVREADSSLPPGAGISAEWLDEFEAAAHRTLEMRLSYAFIHTYKPVHDDAPYRAFDTMEDYRRWCQENLPDWGICPRLNTDKPKNCATHWPATVAGICSSASPGRDCESDWNMFLGIR